VSGQAKRLSPSARSVLFMGIQCDGANQTDTRHAGSTASYRAWEIRARQFLLGLCLVGAMGATQAADSMRCGSRVISVEARAAELLAACGEPAYRDVWTLQRGGSWVSDQEQWYYNFGSSQLLRVVSLRNARIVDIDSDGYGFNDAVTPRCEP